MTNTNNLRARDANAALSAYLVDGADDLPPDENDEAATAGLLAALMHLCDAQGWDFYKIMIEARHAYQGDIADGTEKATADFCED